VDVDHGQLVGRRLNRIVFVMHLDELLAREVFDTLLEAKVLIERWRKAYNTVRPHSALGYRPPAPGARRPCPLASATPQRADRGEPLAGQPW
jgi:transposase InsO family protein